ncbi:hypothetical protein BAE44_0019155 [Dichanthelium oligosanthes]|uniref:Uncharacterized protein n=1 Tax=Dichanthelium oligosanthes TaxID=888268 RepID=A0A1E5V3V0_9POAL|nr:hypothetical protein BAE44_0019155 [Dichanthelium oligosanthes]
MEPGKGKMRRTSSNLLLRITDICKVHSVGVAENVAGKPKVDSTGGSSEDGADLKVHPHQISDHESCSGSSIARYEEAVVEKLLDAISGLKLAYVKVQQAHVPYDPEKIAVAELEELERSNMELKEKIDQRATHREKSFDIGKEASIDMFVGLFESSSKHIHDFTKLVVGWIKVSGWDLDISKFSIDKSVVYEKRSHKKYGVEAYFARAMLMGTKEEYFSMDSYDHVMSFKDPFDALMEAPNSAFGRFCREKYLVAVPWSMEDSFFGNLDHRVFVERGGHPRTQFYQTFARMARYVWALLTVARYLKPRAEMFFVRTGVQFQKKHMESVPAKLTTEEAKISVGFTVMPGFKIGCTVIRCKVYLSKLNAQDF